jgi:hypothetical protein
LPDGISHGLMDASVVEDACRVVGHRWRNCYWRPAVVIMTFLRQVLHGCSCRQAVAQTVLNSAAGDVGMGGSGEGCVSGDPSAYSQARQKLPSSVLRELNRRLTNRLQPRGDDQYWCGRRVRVVDGSSVSMPDAPSLQKAFPQPPQQRVGCGFPIARLVAVFCWGSGAMLALASSSRKMGELRLFRTLYDRFTAGDVVLGDRLFCSYYDMATLLQRGVDSVFRLHAGRSADLRRGHRLGKNDHVIVWCKPRAQATGVTTEQWAAIPDTLSVRHVRVVVSVPGFRSHTIDVVTTLLTPTAYPAEQLAELYHHRWRAELNLRSFKTTLGLEILRCRSVEMIQKELLIGQIAYNMIRLLMAEAADRHGGDLHALSFAGTQQRVLAVMSYWDRCTNFRQRAHLTERLLELIAADRLTIRPNRIEPRCVKRRPKSYPCLFEPRQDARRRALRTHSKSPNKYAAACRKRR